MISKICFFVAAVLGIEAIFMGNVLAAIMAVISLIAGLFLERK